jgi:hypothetical protein
VEMQNLAQTFWMVVGNVKAVCWLEFLEVEVEAVSWVSREYGTSVSPVYIFSLETFLAL